MFRFNYQASDLTNPFVGRHVSLQECYVVQVPKGPSMLEEKLACPMEDAAHERRFLTAQQRSSASTFLDEHVTIIARTVEIIEKKFFESSSTPQDRTYWPLTDPVDTNGCIDYMQDLLYQGDWATGAARSHQARILESDLGDMVEEDDVDEPCTAELQMVIEQARKRRRSNYWQPGQARVHRQIGYKTDPNLRSKPSDSVRNLPRSSFGL